MTTSGPGHSSAAPAGVAAMTVEAFIEALAAKTPVPGGGAAAALALAQGSALAAMVVAYSLGKASLAAHQTALEEARRALEQQRRHAVQLADDDASAYARLNAAMALPKDDPTRASRIAEAARSAIVPPREILDSAAELLERVSSLVPITAPMLRSDLGVAGALAHAAAEGGALNIRANLSLLASDRESVDRASGAALARALAARASLDAALERAAARS
ncbi:MAG: cyclodeaminase/cyclohydrolase family protein [Phycisphaeraceae bacterium]|nr:cyclodeaminase/cyclohydrolase family protein [Phycisphaeraceae bacterium]